MGVGDVICGDALSVQPGALAEAVFVTAPSGARTQVAPPFPAMPFTGTDEAGEYAVTQVLPDGGTATAYFAAYPPPAELDVRAAAPSSAGAAGGKEAAYGRELAAPAIFALILVLLLEWWVSRREN